MAKAWKARRTLLSLRAVNDAPQRADGAVSSVPAPLTVSRGFHRNKNSAQQVGLAIFYLCPFLLGTEGVDIKCSSARLEGLIRICTF